MLTRHLVFSLTLGLLISSSCQEAGPPDLSPDFWPPEVGEPFPDMTVLDHSGNKMLLSSLKGRVLLFEPIGMSCPACVAFCGADQYGAYDGAQPQKGLGSLGDNFRRFANGTSVDDENIAVIQMLFFDGQLNTPGQADAAKWAEHFHIDSRPNHYVVIGPAAIRQQTYDRVPGYWLVDRDFVLQCDSTGHDPASNLYRELLPMVGQLIRAEASPPR